MGKGIITPKCDQLKNLIRCIIDYVNNYDGGLGDIFRELQINTILISYDLPVIELVKTIDKFSLPKENN